MSEGDFLTLREVHAVLQKAFDTLFALYGKIGPDMGSDTAFSIGEATGIVAKAKALVGRDIDDKGQRDGGRNPSGGVGGGGEGQDRSVRGVVEGRVEGRAPRPPSTHDA